MDNVSEKLRLGDPKAFAALPETRSLLGKAEFPQCAKDVLLMLSSYFKNYNPAKQPLPYAENVVRIIDEFIFCCTINLTHFRKRLTAKQELHLLELFCGYFENQSEDSIRNAVFDVLFSAAAVQQGEEYKRGILCKLVSLAVAVKCTSVLNCAAVLMTKQTSRYWVTHLASAIIHDYCLLVPDSLGTLQSVVNISPMFACQLLAAITQLYRPTIGSDKLSLMPASLLEMITEWVSADPMLCLSSLFYRHPNTLPTYHKQHPPQENVTPIAGLINCCVLAPLLSSNEEDLAQKSHQTYSKLHLSVLETMIAYSGAQQERRLDPSLLRKGLVSLQEVKDICDSVKKLNKDIHPSQGDISVDRFAQAVQVALSTGILLCVKDDLKDICIGLPQTRLLQIVLSHTEASQVAGYGDGNTSMMPASHGMPMEY
ncbi:integrator complex subunit 15-like [Ptychodera flava]|uniref:integrator complex subunit 15-like n=1 Tax=Ptychodera flava TaxID=63121 RepID=UPI003969FE05